MSVCAPHLLKCIIARNTQLVLDSFPKELGNLEIKLFFEERLFRLRSFFEGLGAGQIGRILKSLARRAQLPEAAAKNISGHSLRVGAAQDWTTRGISLPQLMVLGGWEKPDTVIRYIGKARVTLEGLRL